MSACDVAVRLLILVALAPACQRDLVTWVPETPEARWDGAANVFQLDGRLDDPWIATASWRPDTPALAPYPLVEPDQCAEFAYGDAFDLDPMPRPTVRFEGGEAELEGEAAFSAILPGVLSVGSAVSWVGLDPVVTVPPDLAGVNAGRTPEGARSLRWDPGEDEVILGIYRDLSSVVCRLVDDGAATLPVEVDSAEDLWVDADIARARWAEGVYEGRPTLVLVAHGLVLGPTWADD